MKINGRAIDVTPTPGSYLTLNRVWKAGDKIEMTLPMHLSVEAMPDDPKTQAFLYGPLVLAGDLGSEGLTEQLTVGPNAPRMRGDADRGPEFPGGGRGPGVVDQARRRAAHLPHHGSASRTSRWCRSTVIFGKRYSVYWQVS